MLMQLDDGWWWGGWQEPYLRSDFLARWLLGGSERYLNARLIVELLRYIPCLFLPTFFLFSFYTLHQGKICFFLNHRKPELIEPPS